MRKRTCDFFQNYVFGKMRINTLSDQNFTSVMPEVWIYNDWKHHVVARVTTERVKVKMWNLIVTMNNKVINKNAISKWLQIGVLGKPMWVL